MARTTDDLKALLVAGDAYTEVAEIEFLNEKFAVQIRPLTEIEITVVNRSMKISASVLKKVSEKMQAGKKLSPSEEEKLKKEVVTDAMADGSLDMGDMAYQDAVLNREFCMRGIVDPDLRAMVPTFRYGLAEAISKRIQLISNVPPAVVINFFGQKPGK
jgi:hypothetical protein